MFEALQGQLVGGQRLRDHVLPQQRSLVPGGLVARMRGRERRRGGGFGGGQFVPGPVAAPQGGAQRILVAVEQRQGQGQAEHRLAAAGLFVALGAERDREVGDAGRAFHLRLGRLHRQLAARAADGAGIAGARPQRRQRLGRRMFVRRLREDEGIGRLAGEGGQPGSGDGQRCRRLLQLGGGVERGQARLGLVDRRDLAGGDPLAGDVGAAARQRGQGLGQFLLALRHHGFVEAGDDVGADVQAPRSQLAVGQLEGAAGQGNAGLALAAQFERLVELDGGGALAGLLALAQDLQLGIRQAAGLGAGGFGGRHFMAGRAHAGLGERQPDGGRQVDGGEAGRRRPHRFGSAAAPRQCGYDDQHRQSFRWGVHSCS